MNKGLEALRDINYICDRIDFHRKHFLGNVDENWIEKRIKQKSSIIEKELKALEIVKALAIFVISQNIGGLYRLETIVASVSLTKEEYELLKKVGL